MHVNKKIVHAAACSLIVMTVCSTWKYMFFTCYFSPNHPFPFEISSIHEEKMKDNMEIIFAVRLKTDGEFDSIIGLAALYALQTTESILNLYRRVCSLYGGLPCSRLPLSYAAQLV